MEHLLVILTLALILTFTLEILVTRPLCARFRCCYICTHGGIVRAGSVILLTTIMMAYTYAVHN